MVDWRRTGRGFKQTAGRTGTLTENEALEFGDLGGIRGDALRLLLLWFLEFTGHVSRSLSVLLRLSSPGRLVEVKIVRGLGVG